MKKVRIVIMTSMAGDGFLWSPGDEVELPAAEAKKLIDAGYATEVKKVKPPPEVKKAKPTDETVPETSPEGVIS